MPIPKILISLLAISISSSVSAQSNPHAGHGGSGASGNNDAACIKAKISNFTPAHLATIAPGGEFSLAVSGSNGPGHIHISIREKPIKVSVENKDTFYLVKGNLPPEIRNETVRISVSAKSKISKCDADGGWLLKVSE